MPNQANITLRSEKGSFLTFEEMDLALLEVRTFMDEYENHVNVQYANFVSDFNALQTEYDQFVINTNASIATLNQNISDINDAQTVQDSRITNNESDIAQIKTHLGIQ